MVYNVIGLMSGSSLDGLDIAFVRFEEIRGQWSYQVIHSQCIPYEADLIHSLKHAAYAQVSDFLKLHTEYGRYIGKKINTFIEEHNIRHEVHFIVSHGHTVFHEPQNHTTCQIGDGSAIAAITGLPVISDLRSLDVALGGQGAPIVPIGDKLLFGNYDYWLNIGGIANITVPYNGSLLAFDVCPANKILNTLAENEGYIMDENGAMAEEGTLLPDLRMDLNNAGYYKAQAPKSLSNETAMELVFPHLLESDHSTHDMLRTVVQLIADQVADAVRKYPAGQEQATMLVTGGGAFNKFLVSEIEKAIAPMNVSITVPDAVTVKFKEALIMALIGTLRWREETNTLSSVTGASRDSIGGAIWMGHSYNG